MKYIRKLLQVEKISLYLYCVFHGIRFKVKKKGCRDDNSLYF